jgi:selenocysteine-specific elongation factor
MAGHIDHGKSTLVTALTGKPMDRLEEERRRGITIDLNFAPLTIGGVQAGVVDVPGHEDFVRTMVAGASGIDLALLVIAADEGIMPQTLEHLAVLEHLRVPAGIPVLTKADLVSPDELVRRSAEVASRLARSAVGFVAPVAVSTRTGQGIDALRSMIEARAATIRARPKDDLFRLPVDRAFSVAGVGTVVTGTAWSGSVSVGDIVTILPARMRGRIRSIEGHGHPLQRSHPGARIALGLAGIRREGISRGAVVVADADPWPVTMAVDAELRLDADAPRALDSRTRVRVLIGTDEVMARVRPRGRIEPGASGLARLALERAVVARGGDRFVIRSYSPVVTVGGGHVLDADPPRRAAWPDSLVSTDPERRLLGLLERRPRGMDTTALPLLLGIAPSAALSVAQRSRGVRQAKDQWVAASAVEAAATAVLDAVTRHHARQPGRAGLPLETLRRSRRVPDFIVEAAIDDLVRTDRLRIVEGVVSLPGHAPRIEGGEEGIDHLVRLVDQAGLTPPTIGELSTMTGRSDVLAAVRLAAARGLVKAVEPDRYYSSGALNRFTSLLIEAGRAGPIHPAALRERVGVSRKYLIPLLEWADRQGITVRMPEGRRLVSPPRLAAGPSAISYKE